jgi:hypothetical protein
MAARPLVKEYLLNNYVVIVSNVEQSLQTILVILQRLYDLYYLGRYSYEEFPHCTQSALPEYGSHAKTLTCPRKAGLELRDWSASDVIYSRYPKLIVY